MTSCLIVLMVVITSVPCSPVMMTFKLDSTSYTPTSSKSNQYEINEPMGPEECPPYAVLACPTKCDPTCTKPLSASNECPQTLSCEQKSCICLPGYVFDEITKKCILSQYCPERCKRNEVWRLCPSACLTHCGNYHEMIIEEDTGSMFSNSATTTIKPFRIKRCLEDERDDYECEAQCVCREGFIRDLLSGNCVTKEICDVTLADFDETGSRYPCPSHEHWSECINEQCVKYCHENYEPKLEENVDDGNETMIEPIQIRKFDEEECKKPSRCVQGCVCDEGYMRLNKGAKCIPDKECNVMLKYLTSSNNS